MKTNPTKSILFQFFSEIERAKKKKKLKLPQSKSASVTYLLQGLLISSVNIVIIIIIIIIIIKQQKSRTKEDIDIPRVFYLFSGIIFPLLSKRDICN